MSKEDKKHIKQQVETSEQLMAYMKKMIEQNPPTEEKQQVAGFKFLSMYNKHIANPKLEEQKKFEKGRSLGNTKKNEKLYRDAIAAYQKFAEQEIRRNPKFANLSIKKRFQRGTKLNKGNKSEGLKRSVRNNLEKMINNLEKMIEEGKLSLKGGKLCANTDKEQ